MTALTPEKIYETLKNVEIGGTRCSYSLETCTDFSPIMNRILELKKQKNAVLLAHSYVSPEIIMMADFVGDSYELSKKAQTTSADTIVFTAVKFMAETAKILNPGKTVLVPSTFNGCSLADSITAADVAQLRDLYPNYTFVCYINTTAAVKALCDVCVTSSNVYKIIERIPNDNIYFLPDKLMAKNVKNELESRGIHKNILWWDGTCYVHETYDPDMIHFLRLKHPDIKVVSHPECDEAVLSVSDFVGSTSQMINYVKTSNAPSYFLLTECGLTSRLKMEAPSKKFVGSCTMCKYMKANSLEDILRVLEAPTPSDVVQLDSNTLAKASKCIEAMFTYAT